MTLKKPALCIIGFVVYGLVDKSRDIKYGGLELQFYLLAKRLVASGFNVTIITGDFGQPDIVEHEGIKFVKVLTPTRGGKLRQVIKLWQALKKINADIHLQSVIHPFLGILALFCKFHGKKVIFRTAHQMDVDGEWISRNRFLGLFYRYGLRNADLILTQNEGHQKMLWEKHQLKSTVFRNVFEIGDRSSIKKESVLWVSRCEKWKRPEMFIRLAAQFPDQLFTMICPKVEGLEDYWVDVRKAAESLRNLTFIEHVHISEIQTHFDRAKVFVSTSQYEGFPNGFLQAASAKTPLLSLNVDPDGFIVHEDCGIFCDDSEERLHEGLKELLFDETLAHKKGENALCYLKENHNLEKGAKILEEMIIALLGARPEKY